MLTDSQWIFGYDRNTRPAIIIIDRDKQIYDVHYRYDDEELQSICSNYDIAYDDVIHRINKAEVEGTHTLMIDVPRYKEFHKDKLTHERGL